MLSVRYAYGKLPAQNVQRARRFFEEKLGLLPYAEVNNHLRYEIGGAYFVIFPSSGSASGTHDQLGFLVEDIKETSPVYARKGSFSRNSRSREQAWRMGSPTSGT